MSTIKRVPVGNPEAPGANSNDFIKHGPGLRDSALRVFQGSACCEELLFRFLDTNGDGTGTKNAIGDYSSGEEFKITVPDGEIFYINRMLIQIRDTGVFSASEYGNLSELSNGIEVYVSNAEGGRVTNANFTDDVPIKSNSDWGRHCFDARPDDYGSGDNYLVVRWTLGATGTMLRLRPGFSLVVALNDNMSGLVQHYFQAQGFRDRLSGGDIFGT